MGKSFKPTYYARYRDQSGWHEIVWNSKSNGRANDANAEQMRLALNRSFDRDGVNFHVSGARGYIIHVSQVEVIRNDMSGRVVARAAAPMFETA